MNEKRLHILVLPFCFLLCSTCFLIALLSGCNTTAKDTVPLAYYDSLIVTAEKGFPTKEQGLDFLDSVYNAHPNASVPAQVKRLGFFCDYYLHTKHDYAKALTFSDTMLALVNTRKRASEYKIEEALANISKADVLFDMKKYPEAYTYYYQGRKAAEKSLDPCVYSEYSYRLGMVMYKRTEYAAAAGFFRQSFEETKTCDLNFWSFYRRQELLNNTALSYNKCGRQDSALIFYNKALAYINEYSSKFPDRAKFFEVAQGVIYGNQAQIYQAQQLFDTAEVLFLKSIAINAKPGMDNGDAQLTRMHLAHLYADKNMPEASLTVLNEVQKSMDSLHNKDVVMDWNNMMWKYYQQKQQPAKAFDYLLHYTQQKDSLATSNKQLIEANVTDQMKDMEAQYQMGLLRNNNNIQRLYLLIVVVFLAMAFVIILMFIRNGRKSKKNITTLTALNNTIQLQKEQLENTLEELEARSNEKDSILRLVAHDLRNPIAAISSLTDVILDANEYPEGQKDRLKMIQKACSNSLELINEILEATIYNKGDQPISKELVDVNMIVRNSVQQLQFKAAEKNQHIRLETPAAQEMILASEEKIWRVMNNLISNAIKFSPSGADIQVKVEEPAEETVRISVLDHGIGIPDNIKVKVFDMFTDAKRAGTDGEKPFGLGLSICKQIVEAHGGKIWLESTQGKGTTFFVQLQKNNMLADAADQVRLKSTSIPH